MSTADRVDDCRCGVPIVWVRSRSCWVHVGGGEQCYPEDDPPLNYELAEPASTGRTNFSEHSRV